MTTTEPAQSSPWEFRYRAWLSFIIYFIGFSLGYAVSYALGGNGTPTYILVGTHWAALGTRGAVTIAASFTCAGFLLRWWGSSYHGAGIVYSRRIETSMLTAAGPYRYTRNPLYLGNMLQAVGIASIGPPPALVIVIIAFAAFLHRLIFLEEKNLGAALGNTYARYCAAVPRLLPRLTLPNLPRSDERPKFVFGLITELGSLGFAVMMVYLAVAAPSGPDRTFVVLFYAAVALFVIGGIANRRMSRLST